MLLPNKQTVIMSSDIDVFLLPNIDLEKPMTDLCWHCQKNNNAI